MTAADEQHLILRVKEGDHGAFRELVERNMKSAYNIAYNFLHDHDDAEDATQESFIRVFESIESFRGDSAFHTWLYRIVTNLSLNKLRQKKHRTDKEMTLIANSPNYATKINTDCQQRDIQPIIERALHELPTLQRAVVILRHLNGLSTKQVSGILNCSEGTVKTHLFRGLKKMKTTMSLLKTELL